ncbi:hypothetical protein IFT48_04695 [Pseudomonas fluorescens]|uniref:hypothetical protein n=1 Tax=Pseudomonas TaxID=286 RepID=UPI000F01F9EB|nr:MULTISPECIES: hypothetical protein [Pseudomonas]MBD8089272.1 hypothetical protein [Pseudomonas fluorescens]MBD8615301.1 hypothetical protein [Pseudomonas putida]MBD8682045.1 hypothetical protein [Pseudomonas sp. CFBP 13719]
MSDINVRSIENCVIAGKKGFLFIGDPLLGGDRRTGRIDNAWDVSMAKLVQAMDIAKSRDLVPVIVGDLLLESRDLSKVLAIINVLKGHRAILLPRDARWSDRATGHIAAVLQAAGVAEIAGFFAKRYQMSCQKADGSGYGELNLECHTPWGGHKRLEQGSRGRVVLTSLDVAVEPHSGIPEMVSESNSSVIRAGRLVRLSAMEEKLSISVFAATLDGIERVSLKVTPIVFSEAAEHAGAHNVLLNQNSKFVDQLKQSAQEVAEEEGKDGLLDLIALSCTDSGADDWVLGKCYELAREAVTPAA